MFHYSCCCSKRADAIHTLLHVCSADSARRVGAESGVSLARVQRAVDVAAGAQSTGHALIDAVHACTPMVTPCMHASGHERCADVP